MQQKDKLFYEQGIPLFLTVVVMVGLSGLLYLAAYLLNLLPLDQKIVMHLRWGDVLVGVTIYLKTSVDFAIFMGRLMGSNPGWKKRVAIEIGTAVGNGIGTILILILWTFFKELDILLALMILLAALVLFELAYTGLEHFVSWEASSGGKRFWYNLLDRVLEPIIKITKPITSRIIPDLGEKLRGGSGLPWRSLLIFSLSVPFILGLDDFAGYVPLFSIVNVFGFGVGVIAAHMVLNIALFLSPARTVAIVRNEWISFFGSFAFIGLGVWGIVEAIKILM